jgi:hypothetical protein
MPGIRYVRAAADGGPLKGGAPRVVWHALGADPQQMSARSAAQHLDQGGRPSHLVWNPLNGEIIQLIPIVRAARSLGWLKSPGPSTWTAGAGAGDVDAEGRVCVQICVVGQADQPFTDGPMVGRREILTWLDSWGVPRSWPAGPPASFPECHAIARSRRLWARGGHFGASQVPGLAATSPGAIDPERLTGWSAAGMAGHRAAAAAPARADGPLPAGGQHPDGGRPGTGYDPPGIGELIGARAGAAASLSRVR